MAHARNALLVALISAAAAAQVPQRLGYQGRLLRADGTPEAASIVTMSFTLYDTPTGGNTRWGPEVQQVGLSNGYYSVQLGTNLAFSPSLFDGADLYLEISVGGADAGMGAPLLPRQRLASVAYAHRAAMAVSLAGGSVDATEVKINGVSVLDTSGNLVGPGAAAFAPSAHTHDASDVVSGELALSRIPQGNGSGLDADLLDGLDSTVFAQRAALSTPGTLNHPENPVDWTRLKNVPPSLAAIDGGVAVVTDSTLTGNGTTGQPLGIDPNEVQRRIATNCAAGTFMQGADVNGTPLCASDLDAASLSSGTISAARLAGAYSGITGVGTLTAGTWQATPIAPAYGGIGLDTSGAPAGALLRTSAAGTWATLAPGSNGQVLKMSGGLPVWGPDLDSGGDITGVTAGSGLLGGGAAGTVSLSVDTSLVQARVNGTCSPGYAVRAINLDGSVTCEQDDNSGGTITSVTASAPLSSSGGTTPNLSIAAASASSDGYLTATDWSTFNAKLGTVSHDGSLVGSGTSASPLGLKPCSSNQVLSWNGATSSWECASAANSDGLVYTVDGF